MGETEHAAPFPHKILADAKDLIAKRIASGIEAEAALPAARTWGRRPMLLPPADLHGAISGLSRRSASPVKSPVNAADCDQALPSRVMGERPSMLLPSPTRTLHGAINRMFNPTLCEFSQEFSQRDQALPSRVTGETECLPLPSRPPYAPCMERSPDVQPDALRVQSRVQSLRRCKL